MRTPGLYLAIAYLIVSGYLLMTHGLFGESFIALILGMPWTLALSYFEFWGLTGFPLTVLLLAPIGANAYLLYRIGNSLIRA